jgi:hypothetical protein
MLDNDGQEPSRPTTPQAGFSRNARQIGLVLLGIQGALTLSIIGGLGSVWDLDYVRQAFINGGLRFGIGATAGLLAFFSGDVSRRSTATHAGKEGA